MCRILAMRFSPVGSGAASRGAPDRGCCSTDAPEKVAHVGTSLGYGWHQAASRTCAKTCTAGPALLYVLGPVRDTVGGALGGPIHADHAAVPPRTFRCAGALVC